jgi:hypothetical protein
MASEHVGIERAERSHHAAPPVEARNGESLRRFVAVALGAFASVLLLTGIANAIVDPLGSVGTGLVQPVVFSDHAERLKLIDHLRQPPQLVVLGSSRALKAEPSYLQQLTGLRGFNAAAANGKTEDGFAYANLFHDHWPKARIRYLWILEVEAFRDRPPSPQLLAEPALAKHFPASLRAGSRLADFQRLFEWQTTKSSVKTVWHALRGAPQEGAVQLGPDGFRAVDAHDVSERAGVPFQSRLNESVATARTFVPAMEKTGLAPDARRYFEEAVADMNGWGVEPVIVLGPVHPAYRAAMGGPAYDRLNEQFTAYLHGLQARGLKFTIADERNLASFGGSESEFYDGIHLHVANMRKMLATAVQEAGAALQ